MWLVPFAWRYQQEVMAKEYAYNFYHGEAWKRCRLGYISHRRAIDGGMCEVCGEAAGYIVHHKKPITARTINDPAITLSFDNLQFVCKNCHDKIHEHCGREIIRERRYVFDAAGNPVPVSTPP